MKKLYVILLLSLFATAFYSCNKELEADENTDQTLKEEVIPEGYKKMNFTAVCEDTKTTLNGSNTVWSEGDQIKVVLNDGTTVDAPLTAGAGTTSGTFAGLVPNGKTALYAVYPASAYASIDGSTVNVTVPAEQPGTFAAGNIAVAKVAADHSMSFKNMNSFLVFQLKDGSEVTKVEVTSVDGSALVGTIPVDCSGDNPAADAPASPASTVSMTTNGAGTYYMSIASGATHTKGLTMTYYTGSGPYTETGVYYLNKNLTIEVNQMYTLGEVETDKNYYVTVAGAGSKNGMNWANAFSAEQMWKKITLTEAQSADAQTKEAKLAAIDGATFHLGAGSYNFGADPTISFSESSPVTLTFIGGYPAAGGTRDIASYRADITGNDEHACLNLRGKLNVTFDGIGFVHGSVTGDNVGSLDINGTASGSDITVSMSNCLVDYNVNASYSSHEDEWAAGLVLNGSHVSFTAENVTFSNNQSHSASAVFVKDAESVFTNCSFHDNSAWKDAGAVYANADVTFDSCVFEDNKAETGDAGALYAKGGHVIIDGGSFERNTAVNGGAMAIDWGNVTIKGGAVFSANEAAIGGAIYNKCDDSPALRISEDCEFNGNHATDYAGAIHYKNPGILRITDCTFSGNYAEGDSGALNIDRADCIFTRVTFTGNQAKGDAGGALWIDSGSYLFDACNFINNSSNAGTKGGGAIFADSSGDTKIMSCGFSGNKAKRGGAISAYEITDGSLFMDACWFEGNYINSSGSDNNGTTIYCLKTKKLGINNCSFKDGTYNSGDNKCDWIYIDGGSKMKELVISNCTLIGACRKSSSANCTNGSELLYVLKGSSSFDFYCINNVIISTGKANDDGMWVNGVTVKEYNNIYSSRGGSNSPTWDGSGNITDGSGNSTLSALSWDPDDHVYPWDGTGFSYTKISATTFATQMENGCSAFKTWLETKGRLSMDQLGNNRGDGSWVPGAYQPDV